MTPSPAAPPKRIIVCCDGERCLFSRLEAKLSFLRQARGKTPFSKSGVSLNWAPRSPWGGPELSFSFCRRIPGKANTNVIKIARALEPFDTRKDGTPIHQIVFYCSGLGRWLVFLFEIRICEEEALNKNRSCPGTWSSFDEGLVGAGQCSRFISNHSSALLKSFSLPGLAIKVEECYSFVSHNYSPGDEVRHHSKNNFPWRDTF